MKNRLLAFSLVCIVYLVVGVSTIYAFKLDNDIIIDDKGRHVKVIRPYTRIISLYPAHTENICALNSAKELVGISISDTYPKYILNKIRFSYHFGVERFLAVKPDLILIRPMIDFAYPGLIKKFEKENITVISLQPNNISSLYTYWKILGKITGHEKLSGDMISDFKNSILFFKSINNKIKNKKKVYFESIHRKFKTFSRDSIPIFVLTCAGGINIAKDAYQVRHSNIADYGKEKLLSKASKIDVFISQYGRMNRIRVEDIIKEPGFEIIKAVKNKEVYTVDEELTSRPTLRLLMGIYEIGHILYPHYYNSKVKQKVEMVLKKYYKK